MRTGNRDLVRLGQRSVPSLVWPRYAVQFIRVVESIDNMRDLLKGALEANLLLASVQQNDVTKRLAAWAAILAVPTAIAGIYGMSFKHMPELEHPAGYPTVLLGIAVLCSYLYYRFKRSAWL